MPLDPGTKLVSFEIEDLLAQSETSKFYRAFDVMLRQDVAIKVLPEDSAMDPKCLARFERDAKMLAAFDHPHVVTVQDFGEGNGVQFLVMALV